MSHGVCIVLRCSPVAANGGVSQERYDKRGAGTAPTAHHQADPGINRVLQDVLIGPVLSAS